MTLEKAIEILTDLLGEGPQYPPNDRRDAVKLGREALNRIQKNRIWPKVYHGGELPGETKD